MYPFPDVISYYMRRWGKNGGKGLRALDVGCGSGVHSNFLAGFGIEVVSMDFSESSIAHAKQLFPHPNISYQVSDFASFKPQGRKFDLAIDRCSTTHSSKNMTKDFYKMLQNHLAPGASLFWQGFNWDNSGRKLGREQADGSWSEFSGGIFKELGSTAFFKHEDLPEVFTGYIIENVRRISDLDMKTEHDHSSWIVELKYA